MGQNIEKKIYIPEQIKNVFVGRLPISTNLAELFNAHKINVIGDLQEISVEALKETTDSLKKPFPELRHYILAFQESENNEIILITNEQTPKNELDQIKLKEKSDSLASILSQKIFIPLSARSWRIADLPISPLLIEKLNKSGCGKLYDIQGAPYGNFARIKTFEIEDILEFYSFVIQLHSIDDFRSIEAKVSTASIQVETDHPQKTALPVVENSELSKEVFSSATNSSNQVIQMSFNAPERIQTPAVLKNLPINYLAPSKKLETLLKKINIFYFGQLKLVSYSELRATKKFDAGDISELQILVTFAINCTKHRNFSGGFGFIKKAALERRENESVLQETFVDNLKPSKVSDKQKQSVDSNKNQTQNEQNRVSQADAFSTSKIAVPAISTQKFVIPPSLKEIQINKFNLSIELANIFNKLEIEVVGDLEKISYNDLTRASIWTTKEKSEFWQFLFQIENGVAQPAKSTTREAPVQPEALDLSGVMNFINQFLSKLLSTDREILLDRFGGSSDEQVLTFEAIANKHQITRERAYQIYLKTWERLADELRHRAENSLKKLNNDCLSAVCPLIPKFLVYLTNKEYELFQHPPAFYIRIFGTLLPKLPVLPEIKNQNVTLKADAKKIEQEIKSFLENSLLPVSLSEVFNRVMVYYSNKETAETNFFEAVQSAKFTLIETDNPKELFIELREKGKF